MSTRSRSVAIVIFTILIGLKSQAANIVWTNSSGGLWQTALNWSPNQVPGPADNVFVTNNGTYTVTINSSGASNNTVIVGGTAGTQTLSLVGGTLTIFGAGTINPNGVFALAGGVLQGNGDLTIKGTLNWIDGNMVGAGRTILANGATATLGGNITRGLNRTFDNAGTVNYGGTGLTFGLGGPVAGVINNLAGGVFNVSGDGDFNRSSTAAHAFNNAGTFHKNGAGTTTTFNGVVFNNTGVVNLTAGTLQFDSGGGSTSPIDVGAGASLNFNSTFNHAVSGTAIGGAGTINFNSGTHDFVGQFLPTGTVNFNAGTITLANPITPAVLGPIAATVNFNASQNFSNMTLTGGALGGSADVTISGALNWIGGSMAGAGKTILASGATAILGGNATRGLNRTFDNAGTVNYGGTGLAFGLGGPIAGVINNLAGGVFNVSGDGDFNRSSSAAHAFNNAGTFNKNGAGTTTTFNGVVFNNTGMVNLTAGTLEFDSGGGSTSPIDVGAGATLNFNSTFNHAVSGTALGGAGTINFNSGTHNFVGQFLPAGTVNFNAGTITLANPITPAVLGPIAATVNFNAAQNFSTVTLISGGTLGGSADVTITSALNWIGGNMVGAGKTILANGATATLGGNFTRGLNRTFDNAGTVNYGGTGLTFGFGGPIAGVINNLPGGVFNVSGDGDFNQSSSAAHAFNNAGTFNKNGAGTATTFNGVVFNNTGVVNLTAGTLQFDSGGGSATPIDVGAGATLNFNNTFNHAVAGTALSGAGTINFNSGTHNFVGQFLPTGTVNFNVGTIMLANPITPAVLGPIAATVNFNAPQNFSSVTLVNGGTLGGSADVTITSALNWIGGSMVGAGKTIMANGATATLGGNNTRGLNRTFDNAGTVNYGGTGLAFGLGGPVAGVVNNLPGGVFNVSGDGDFSRSSSAAHAFNNAGTFHKNGAGTMTTFNGVVFDNTGVVTFTGGTLEFNSGGGSTSPIDVAVGATLNFNSTFNHAVAGTALSGAGTINFSSSGTHNFVGQFLPTGTVNFNSGTITLANPITPAVLGPVAATVNFNAAQNFSTVTLTGGALGGSADVTITGALNWSSGSMTGAGRTILASGATATLGGNITRGLNRTLENAGTINYGGTGLTFGFGGPVPGVINNLPGGVFNVSGDGDFNQSSSAAHAFNNAGTFNKSGAGTTTTFTGVVFTNTGVVMLVGGTLQLFNGISFAGGSALQSVQGTTLRLSTGNLTSTATNSAPWSAQGRLLFDPGAHQLEVMSRDLGNLPVGYVNNFAYGTIELAPSANVTLVDNSDNVPGAEAVYADTLIVPAGATLNLNGLRLYARVSQISGVTSGNTTPIITQQPADQTVASGANVVLQVAAIPLPLTFQWKRNGVTLPGQTNSTLSLTNVGPSSGGLYSVIVANQFDAVSSRSAVVTVQSPALPFADDFASAGLLTAPSGFGSSNNFGATKQLGEPNHAGKPGGRSIWINWVAPQNGIVIFASDGTSFDTLLAAYLGANVGGLIEVASDDDTGPSLSSRISFRAIAGTVYHLAVDSFSRMEGPVVLTWQFEPTIDTPPVIITHPTNQVVAVGGTAQFSVVVEPNPGTIQYQWFLNGNVIPGATTDMLTLPSVTASNVGSYFVRVIVGSRSTDSRGATLQLIQGNAPDAGLAGNKFADVTSDAQPTGPVGLKHRIKAVAKGFTGTQLFSTVGSATEPGEPNHCGVIGGASYWFAYQSPTNGFLLMTTEGSSFDTVLAIYTGPGDDFATLVPAACDNNSGADGRDSKTAFPVTSGTIYWVAVDGVRGVTGHVMLNWNLLQPPVITTQPSSRSVAPGANVTFDVAATGSTPISYQWRFNTNNILGATGSSFTLSNVQLTNAGNYSVLVSNPATTVASAPAVLTVSLALELRAPMKVANGMRFTVASSPGVNFTVQGSTALTNWQPLLATNSATGLYDFTDTNAAGFSSRFYRAVYNP